MLCSTKICRSGYLVIATLLVSACGGATFVEPGATGSGDASASDSRDGGSDASAVDGGRADAGFDGGSHGGGIDAGSLDAALDATRDAGDAGDLGSIACGSTTCAASTEFCRESGGGPPPPPDSGPSASFDCPAFPSACAADHTCACLQANGACSPGGLFSCRVEGAGLHVDCAYP